MAGFESGGTAYRGKRLEADYLLEHSPGRAVSVVEAKRKREPASSGVEQALRYARIFHLHSRTRITGTRS